MKDVEVEFLYLHSSTFATLLCVRPTGMSEIIYQGFQKPFHLTKLTLYQIYEKRFGNGKKSKKKEEDQ